MSGVQPVEIVKPTQGSTEGSPASAGDRAREQGRAARGAERAGHRCPGEGASAILAKFLFRVAAGGLR